MVNEMTSQMDIFPLISVITGTHISENKLIDGKNIISLIEVGIEKRAFLVTFYEMIKIKD